MPQLTPRRPIETISLSDDEDDDAATAAAVRRQQTQRNYSHHQRIGPGSSKPPINFVDLSDEDDINFGPANILSSTHLSKTHDFKSPAGSLNSSRKANTSDASVTSCPDVKPINTLRERQQSKACMQENAIDSIVRKFQESKKQRDSLIKSEEIK